MTLSFCSFASGSTGNCYMVKSENTTILIDVGISGKKIVEGLSSKNIEIEEIDCILITHEHSDHIKSLKLISKKAINAKVFASIGTWSKIIDLVSEEKIKRLEYGKPILIGDILVSPFKLSHDTSDPIGYSFKKGDKKITIVTDTGYVTEEIFENIKDADLLVLEANHEVNILQFGKYPYSLKRRILGEKGHLSNEAAGNCICQMLEYNIEAKISKMPKVVLAHLSRENNTPEQAYLTIKNILGEKNFYMKKDLTLEVITRDKISDIMCI